MQPDDLFPSTVATEDQCDGVHCRSALRPDVRTTSAEMLRLLHLISKHYPTDPELPVLVIHAAVAEQVEHVLVHRSAKTTPLQAEVWRLEPAGEGKDGLWGTLRVCATPGPHGGPWPLLETEVHFVTRLANTVCAVWTFSVLKVGELACLSHLPIVSAEVASAEGLERREADAREQARALRAVERMMGRGRARKRARAPGASLSQCLSERQ